LLFGEMYTNLLAHGKLVSSEKGFVCLSDIDLEYYQMETRYY